MKFNSSSDLSLENVGFNCCIPFSLASCNTFKIVKKSDVTKLQKTLISKNIYVDLFQRNYPSLNDIYEDMIVFGSTDTMRETNPSKLEIK